MDIDHHVDIDHAFFAFFLPAVKRLRGRSLKQKGRRSQYCIVLYLLLVLNPESYDGARVLEASGRPMKELVNRH